MERLIQFLDSIFPMSDGCKETLLEQLKMREIARKEFLLRAGHICQHIYFIEEGLLRCFYYKNDVEICSWFMKEGDVVVSVESFFNQTISYESIQALDDSVLYYLSYKELQDIYKKFPEFNYISRVLTERYYCMSERRLYSIRMMRSTERYDSLLQEQPGLISRVPAKYLASYLGITPEMLSKIKGVKNQVSK